MRCSARACSRARRQACAYLLTLVRAVEATEGRASIPAVEMESFPAGERWQARAGHARRRTQPDHVRRTASPRWRRRAACVHRQRVPEATPEPAEKPAAADETTGLEPANENDRKPSAPPPPIGLSAADEARWNELVKLYRSIDELNHFDLLKVAKTASQQELESSVLRAGEEVPSGPAAAVAGASRARRAAAVRAPDRGQRDAEQRRAAAWLRTGRRRPAAARARPTAPCATCSSPRSSFRRPKCSCAGASTRRPCSCCAARWQEPRTKPTTTRSTRGSCTSPTRARPRPLDEMLRSLDRALKSNPRHERAHYYKRHILKRLKRDSEAVRHFRMAAELNPHNVDAAREVRLAVDAPRLQKPPRRQPGRAVAAVQEVRRARR